MKIKDNLTFSNDIIDLYSSTVEIVPANFCREWNGDLLPKQKLKIEKAFMQMTKDKVILDKNQHNTYIKVISAKFDNSDCPYGILSAKILKIVRSNEETDGLIWVRKHTMCIKPTFSESYVDILSFNKTIKKSIRNIQKFLKI